ncbi:MAG: hypothetical protein ACRD5L_11730, partial [Bryobacteraceae bacterium]
MNPNLKWKAVFIICVALLCVYGVTGLPNFPTSWAGVKQNFADRIKLGLDLQGGTHLVLQVQVNEAVQLQTDETVDQLSKNLRDKSVAFGQVLRNTDSQIKVSDITPDQSSNFRGVVSDFFPDWEVAGSPGEPNSYLLNMRPSAIAAIEQRTMSQSVGTIRRRIDALGLKEPVVAPYGRADNEIIVELAGESDPGEAKRVISAGGQLQIQLVADNTPYPSQDAAMAAHNGILPANTELVQNKLQPGETGAAATESW